MIGKETLEMKKTLNYARPKESPENTLPEFVLPRIVTYTQDQLLERIGPAQAASATGP